MDKVSAALPSKIEETFNLPKVRELVACTSRGHVQQYIHFELIRLTRQVNTGGNMTGSQLAFAAEVLEEDFPNETLADFKICFRNAAAGRYNSGGEKDIFRLDAITIRRWMVMYLEEKYTILEKQIKTTQSLPESKVETKFIPDAIAKQWQAQIDEAAKAMSEKKPRPITAKEIAAEGQTEPPARVGKVHEYTPRDHKRQIELKAEYGRTHCDLRTGKLLPGHPTFEEWIKTVKK